MKQVFIFLFTFSGYAIGAILSRPVFPNLEITEGYIALHVAVGTLISTLNALAVK